MTIIIVHRKIALKNRYHFSRSVISIIQPWRILLAIYWEAFEKSTKQSETSRREREEVAQISNSCGYIVFTINDWLRQQNLRITRTHLPNVEPKPTLYYEKKKKMWTMACFGRYWTFKRRKHEKQVGSWPDDRK